MQDLFFVLDRVCESLASHGDLSDDARLDRLEELLAEELASEDDVLGALVAEKFAGPPPELSPHEVEESASRALSRLWLGESLEQTETNRTTTASAASGLHSALARIVEKHEVELASLGAEARLEKLLVLIDGDPSWPNEPPGPLMMEVKAPPPDLSPEELELSKDRALQRLGLKKKAALPEVSPRQAVTGPAPNDVATEDPTPPGGCEPDEYIPPRERAAEVEVSLAKSPDQHDGLLEEPAHADREASVVAHRRASMQKPAPGDPSRPGEATLAAELAPPPPPRLRLISSRQVIRQQLRVPEDLLSKAAATAPSRQMRRLADLHAPEDFDGLMTIMVMEGGQLQFDLTERVDRCRSVRLNGKECSFTPLRRQWSGTGPVRVAFGGEYAGGRANEVELELENGQSFSLLVDIDAMFTVRAKVQGRVQGVHYRQFLSVHARTLGVRGHAKNLADGTVEVLAQGDERAVKSFLFFVEQGPQDEAGAAAVTSVSVESVGADQYEELREFEVL
jgi:acylphosphatase